MKAELVFWQGDVLGVELTARNEEEDATLRRFNEDGIKVNAITPRPDNKSTLQLTFQVSR